MMLFCFFASPKTFLTFPFVPKSKRFAPESFGGGAFGHLIHLFSGMLVKRRHDKQTTFANCFKKRLATANYL